MLFTVAVLFTLISSIFFIIAGVSKSIIGYIAFIKVGFHPPENEFPGLYLLEGLDSFMISLVFMIFGLGIARLFIFPGHESDNLPKWLQVKDLHELKKLMWETILFTLVVVTVTHIFKSGLSDWTAFILPGILLLLSLSYFVVNRK